MKPVWAVTSGEYSDYRVHALWVSKAEAEAFAARDSDRDVQEFTLFEPGDEGPMPVTDFGPTVLAAADIARYDGQVTWNDPVNLTGPETAALAVEFNNDAWLYQDASRPLVDVGYTLYGKLRVQVVARTEEQARRCLQDRVAKERAEMLGVS